MQKAKVQKANPKKIRYAVVGLGYFSQTSALPAFVHAGKNSELVALVSDDPEKLAKLGRKYKVKGRYSYDQYELMLASGEVDAVYIALPNDMHKEYAVRAAKAGAHVLCEKPMALTEKDCQEMIRTAHEHRVRLMIAYRLHLDAANLQAIETVKTGKIGDARFITSVFSMQVKDGNTRVQPEHGGGPVYDLGIYCINAARYLFQDEPIGVTAIASRKKGDPRFQEVDEMVSVILRFPRDRQAAFTCSFGAADLAEYTVVGTKGTLHLKQAFDNAFAQTLEITLDGKTRRREFPKKDQLAAEFLYFSDCILKGKEPEPSGQEGLADVRIIADIDESLRTGKPVAMTPVPKRVRPSADMEIHRPPADKPELFHAESPTLD
ncbi:MAG: Gfo/Idh/MocA family oxidoreductase [Fibrobacteria bacterium]